MKWSSKSVIDRRTKFHLSGHIDEYVHDEIVTMLIRMTDILLAYPNLHLSLHYSNNGTYGTLDELIKQDIDTEITLVAESK